MYTRTHTHAHTHPHLRLLTHRGPGQQSQRDNRPEGLQGEGLQVRGTNTAPCTGREPPAGQSSCRRRRTERSKPRAAEGRASTRHGLRPNRECSLFGASRGPDLPPCCLGWRPNSQLGNEQTHRDPEVTSQERPKQFPRTCKGPPKVAVAVEWSRTASSLQLPHTRSPTRSTAADPTGAAPLWPHAGPGHTKRKAQAYGLIMALVSIGFKPWQNLHKFHIFTMSKCPGQWCSVRPHHCATVPTVHVQGSFHLPGQELCPQETRTPPPQLPHRAPGAQRSRDGVSVHGHRLRPPVSGSRHRA